MEFHHFRVDASFSAFLSLLPIPANGGASYGTSNGFHAKKFSCWVSLAHFWVWPFGPGAISYCVWDLLAICVWLNLVPGGLKRRRINRRMSCRLDLLCAQIIKKSEYGRRYNRGLGERVTWLSHSMRSDPRASMRIHHTHTDDPVQFHILMVTDLIRNQRQTY